MKGFEINRSLFLFCYFEEREMTRLCLIFDFNGLKMRCCKNKLFFGTLKKSVSIFVFVLVNPFNPCASHIVIPTIL
jgi:hypothetical protein